MSKVTTYIDKKLEEYNYDISEVQQLYSDFKRATGSNASQISYHRRIREVLQTVIDSAPVDEQEILEETIQTAKQKQRLQDKLRIARKQLREQFRVFNAIDENTEIIKNLLIEKKDIWKIRPSKKAKAKKDKAFGVLQISDVHFNELIESSQNQYDFIIASKRLKKFVTKSLQYFKLHNMEKVLVAFTGDLMNSDRRLDEFLNQATNRSKATLLACYILYQMILDIAQDFKVEIVSVYGNESRVKEEYGFSDIIVTDNYDWTINNILKWKLDGCKSVNFIETKDFKESIVSLGEFNLLIVHGDSFKGNLDNAVQKAIARYSVQGIRIDYVISGHKHFTYVSDFFAQGSSVVGGNAYSSHLNVASRASQNCYIVKGKTIDRLALDIQDVSDITDFYEIEKDLETYNAKSVSKTHDKKVEFQVVI